VNQSLFKQGLTHYQRGDYFEAHEAWEDAWHEATEPTDRALLKGLVQAAVCLEHARRGNPRGCVRMADRCANTLAGVGVHRGIDTPSLVAALNQWVAPVRALDVQGFAPGKVRGMKLPVDWQRVPTIEG